MVRGSMIDDRSGELLKVWMWDCSLATEGVSQSRYLTNRYPRWVGTSDK